MTGSNTKPWYTSRTIIAGIVALMCNLVQVAGYDSPDEGVLTQAILDAVEAISIVVAIAGRVDATQRIGK